jgi:hypothetical protein
MAGDGSPTSASRSGSTGKSSFGGKFLVPIVFVAFVIMRAMDRAFLNRVLKIMGPYGGALMNLYWPICIQLMTLPVILGYVCQKRFVEGDLRYGLGFLSPCSQLASAKGPVAVTTLAMFSFWDQLNTAAQTVPQAFLPPSMQVALNNTVVAWTAGIAYFYLGSRFSQVHYFGCLLVMVAVLVGMVVELQSGGLPSPVSPDGSPVEVSSATMALMYVIFFLGVVPMAISNCYKQKVLKTTDVDVMYATFWSGFFQVLWGLLMYTMNWIPYPVPGGHNTQSPSTLGADLGDSWTCFWGENPNYATSVGDSCTTGVAWVWFAVYLLFNISFNLLMLWLTKYLSATWASIGSILCGDLYGVFGQFSIISGAGSKMMPLEQWLALILSSMAMWIYNMEDETNVDGGSVYGVPEGGKESKVGESDPAADLNSAA